MSGIDPNLARIKTNSHDSNLGRMRKQLIVGVALSTLITGTIIAAIASYIFYEDRVEKQDRNLLNEVRLRVNSVEIFVQHIRDISQQISSRTTLREKLVEYGQGVAGLEQVALFHEKVLNDAIRDTPNVYAIIRLASNQKLIAQIGGNISESAWENLQKAHSLRNSIRATIGTPILFDGNYLFPVVNSIRDNNNVIIGTDILFFRSENLRNSLNANITDLPGDRKILLANLNSSNMIESVFPSGLDSTSAAVKSQIKTAILSSNQAGAGIVQPTSKTDAFRIAYAPIPLTQWILVEWIATGSLYKTVRDSLVPVTIALLTLVLLCRGIAAVLLRPLAGSILIRADEMAAEVKAKTSELEQKVTELSRIGLELRKSRDQAETTVSSQIMALSEANLRFLTELESKSKLLSELKQSKINAESANATKSEWIALISHEIRNPLSVVIGHADLLSSNILLDDNSKQSIAAIERSSNFILDMVNDLLDHSKLEAGKLEINKSRVNFRVVVHEVISSFKLCAEQKGINLEVIEDPELPEFAITDPKRLRQILLNLVGNAVKFTDQGFVKIEIASKPNTKSYKTNLLEFKITDSGKGISNSESTQLFSRFGQANSEICGRFGGTGLGLFLAKNLAMALGGDVFLQSSTPGKGSVFVATIDSGTLKLRSESNSIAQIAPRANIPTQLLND